MPANGRGARRAPETDPLNRRALAAVTSCRRAALPQAEVEADDAAGVMSLEGETDPAVDALIWSARATSARWWSNRR